MNICFDLGKYLSKKKNGKKFNTPPPHTQKDIFRKKLIFRYKYKILKYVKKKKQILKNKDLYFYLVPIYFLVYWLINFVLFVF